VQEQDASELDASETGVPDADETTDAGDGFCEACDSIPASNPVVYSSGGTGNVTTYGNVSAPLPSNGGACNYGSTQINYFAAINVNVNPNDSEGQWRGGKICGQCVRVKTKTPQGWKEVVVRIMDKCADQYCGIDLGGAPARDLMGEQPGRYQGSWSFVSCEGYEGVSDGPPSILVKDGSNPWWALIQVRNPLAAVAAIDWESADGSTRGSFALATEAENFYTVPEEVRMSLETIRLTIRYSDQRSHLLEITGNALTEERATYRL
jgi:expansin (peptidoglycan-binding protein)